MSSQAVISEERKERALEILLSYGFPQEDCKVAIQRVVEDRLKAKDDDCPVCMDEIPVVKLDTCGHCFCKTCIDRIFAETFKIDCPLCRSEMNRVEYYHKPEGMSKAAKMKLKAKKTQYETEWADLIAKGKIAKKNAAV